MWEPNINYFAHSAKVESIYLTLCAYRRLGLIESAEHEKELIRELCQIANVWHVDVFNPAMARLKDWQGYVSDPFAYEGEVPHRRRCTPEEYKKKVKALNKKIDEWNKKKS